MTNKFPILTGLLAEFATLMEQHINSQNGTTPQEPAAESQAPAASRRGRPPKQAPATPPAEEKPVTPPAEEPVKGAKTEEELRELIKPLVEDGRGEEVKKLITKHGGTKLADLPAKNHAAFVRDIEALTM